MNHKKRIFECPFCTSLEVRMVKEWDEDMPKSWWASCQECSARGPRKISKRLALKAWNAHGWMGEKESKWIEWE